jgi:hypothetical protein
LATGVEFSPNLLTFSVLRTPSSPTKYDLYEPADSQWMRSCEEFNIVEDRVDGLTVAALVSGSAATCGHLYEYGLNGYLLTGI